LNNYVAYSFGNDMPTGGEAFAAARARGDHRDMVKRAPSMMHSFAAPILEPAATAVGDKVGKAAGVALDPMGYLFRSFW
jgi:hypothetical protein